MSASSRVFRKPPPVSGAPAGGSFAAWGHANFRLYILGQLVSFSGTMMQRVAQGWLVYQLTKSEAWLGLVAFAVGFPILIIAPFAGVIADRVSRRRIMLITQAVEMLAAFLLAVLTFSGAVQSWQIAVLALVLGINSAFGEPARIALIRELVDRETLNSAVAMNALMMNTASIIGPALAGVALVQFGAAWCFLINGLSYVAVLASLLLIHVSESYRGVQHAPMLQEMREGLRFARTHTTIAPLLFGGALMNIFGISTIQTLIPAFADVALNEPKTGNAALNATLGIGSVLAAAFNVLIGRRLGRGRLVHLMALTLPLVSVLFGLTGSLALACLLSALLGFGYTTFFVTSNILIQTQTTDEYRGRVVSLWTLNRFAFAPISGLLIGFAAQGFGTPQVMAACGVICGLLMIWIVGRSASVRDLG